MGKLSRRQAMLAGAAAVIAAQAKASPGGVDDGGFLPIGGIDQWVQVRGRDAAAPLMLFLHGGPGEAMSPFASRFEPYEQDFTVALWDQRGAGKTYGRSGRDATPGMDRQQFVQDGVEVAQALLRRHGKRKLVLVGHSWGAALGLYIAQRRPDLFHAFVGTGQPVSNALAVESQERWARGVMTAKGDQEGLSKLDAVADLPPTDDRRRFATRGLILGPDDQAFIAVERAYVGPQPFPKTGDIADWVGGFSFTSNVLVPKIMKAEVVDVAGYDVPLPYGVIQGRDDRICPTEVARDYVAKVRAPAKAFTEIDGGHFACLTHQAAFLEALRRYVPPLCAGG